MLLRRIPYLVLLFFSSISIATSLVISFKILKPPLFSALPFSPLHHVVVIREKDTKDFAVLDFLPKNANNPFVVLKLVLGYNELGSKRITLSNCDNKSLSIILSAVNIGWSEDTTLNIYNRNCQHFSDYVWKTCVQISLNTFELEREE